MIEFGPHLVRPSYHRDPWFAGSETSDRVYSWQCVSCQVDVHASLETILREAWSWETHLGEEPVPWGLNLSGLGAFRWRLCPVHWAAGA